MSYILYNVDNRTVHTYSQERPTYYGYDFVFIAGIGVGLLIYKTFFLPASLQQQQQQLQLQQLEEKKKQQEEEDKRQQQQTQQHQQLQQPHKQQPREDSMIKYLKGALVVKMVTKLLLLVGLISMVTSEEYTWMSNALFGSSLELSCNDSSVMIQAEDIVSWKTPDGKNVTNGYTDSDYKVKGGQGEILLIENLMFANMGIYTCTVTKSSDGMVRAYRLRGVNLDGPQFANLNEKYEENITVAFIASLVFAVPLVGIMVLEKCRYEKRNEDKTGQAYIVPQEKKTSPQVVVTAYDNPACDNQIDDFSTQL